MDIHRFNFWHYLPMILQTICNSCYVAVDLEMSGITVNDNSQPQPASTKPTLQKEYERAKAAAESYTILQLGLTCINWDRYKKSYETKTFTITLDPGVVVNNNQSSSNDPSSGLCRSLDRCFIVSDKSLSVLQDNKSTFSAAFSRGVPFLSEKECSSDKVSTFIRSSGPSLEEYHFDVADLPQASTKFYNELKERISNWRAQKLSGPLTVYSPSGPGYPLNGLQKRLVRQLLHTQFPDFKSVRQGNSLKIVMKHDAFPSEYTTRARTKAVGNQIGARILWDAIRGQSFANNVDLELLSVGADQASQERLKTQLEGYESQLRENSPILIGHNMLYDLCFLRSKFVGDLPGLVEDFRAVTRSELPRIVDTKYLYTRGEDEMYPDYNLGQCFYQMEGKRLPSVKSRVPHSYSKPRHHEAGYDSYMTAIVFLKKAHQLAQTGKRLGHIASDDLGEEVATSMTTPQPAPRSNLLEQGDQDTVAESAGTPTKVPPMPTKAPLTAPPTPKHESKSPNPGPSRTSDEIPE